VALGATLCPWPLDRCNPPLVLYAVAEVEPCLGNRWINYLYSGISLSSNDVEAAMCFAEVPIACLETSALLCAAQARIACPRFVLPSLAPTRQLHLGGDDVDVF
jgi:hypothetical protein